MWRHLTAALPSYGPLTTTANLHRFVESAVEMTQVPGSHLRWKHDLSVDDVLSRISEPAPTAAIAALYAEYARREAASGWVCKENNLFDHAFQICDTLSDAKFLYLCRDGRDVACSMKKVPTHDQHVFFIAHEWKSEQHKCLQVHQALAARDRSRIVRYEDLIEHPEEELRRISDFLGLGFQKRMLYFHETEEARDEAEKTEYWENLSQPVMSDNKGKFYDQLSEKEVRIFETVAADELAMLGYPITTDESQRGVSRWKRLWFRLENRVRKYFQSWDASEKHGRDARDQMLRRVYNPWLNGPTSFAKEISYTDDRSHSAVH
jgi:hypothetical protein